MKLLKKGKLLDIKVFLSFSVYSILLIIAGIVFTSTNVNRPIFIDMLGKFAFFCWFFVLLFSIFLAVKKRTTKLLILFYTFIIPAFYLMIFEFIFKLFD